MCSFCDYGRYDIPNCLDAKGSQPQEASDYYDDEN